jgi:hypothetical protein
MKKCALCLLILVFCLYSACSQKSDNTAALEVIDGIEYIHNLETSLNPDRTIYLEEELSIGVEDEEKNIVLFQPGWFLVDRNENIYISDLGDMQIKVFDPAGHMVHSIGRKGSGPGEFQSIGRLMLLPDGRLLVLDWGERRISLLHTDGQFISSHKVQRCYDVYLCADSFYIREEMTLEPGQEPMEFKRRIFAKAFEYDGKEVFSYGEFQASQSAFVKGRFSFSKPYDIYSILVGDQNNKRLYHCLNDKYLIEVFDHTGKLIRKIDRPYKRIPVTEQDKKEYLDGFRKKGSTEEQVALIEEHAEMPELKPVTSRMIVDDSGSLWIELNEKKEEEGQILTAYDIFNQDGFYEAKIWMGITPIIIKSEKMYTRETDKETGYPVYKRYLFKWND